MPPRRTILFSRSRLATTGWIVGLIGVAVFGVAACSDSSDSTDTSSDPGEASVSTGAPPSPEAGSPDGASAVGDFCSINDELARLFGELAASTGDDAEATWLNIEIVVQWIREEAPPELADDVATGTEYYTALGEALRAADFEDPVAVVESLPQGAEMEQIEARVDDYLDESCRP